jgi:hypothetical protein
MHPHTAAAKTTTILTSRSRQMPVANKAAEHRTEPLAPSAAAYTDAAGHGAKAAKKRGVQKLLMSAFKRVDQHESVGASGSSTSTGGGNHHVVDAAAAQDFTWSSSSSTGGSSGRKGRRAGGGDQGSADGDHDVEGTYVLSRSQCLNKIR